MLQRYKHKLNATKGSSPKKAALKGWKTNIISIQEPTSKQPIKTAKQPIKKWIKTAQKADKILQFLVPLIAGVTYPAKGKPTKALFFPLLSSNQEKIMILPMKQSCHVVSPPTILNHVCLQSPWTRPWPTKPPSPLLTTTSILEGSLLELGSETGRIDGTFQEEFWEPSQRKTNSLSCWWSPRSSHSHLAKSNRRDQHKRVFFLLKQRRLKNIWVRTSVLAVL